MRIGRLDIYVLNDGVYRMDGGVLFGQVPKIRWQALARPDRKNRVRLALNCLLIQAPEGNILVDTGAGSKWEANGDGDQSPLSAGKLLKGLRDLGVQPSSIQYVVLTHLHFTHAGGCTRYTKRRELVPTFPRARYLVQRAAWEDAVHPTERSRPLFCAEDFQPLLEQEQIEFLDGDVELVRGIWLKVTNGHCRGHQIVLINQGATKAVFFGDLIPTLHHLSLPFISAEDQFPEETLESKRDLVAKAERDRWLLLFAHQESPVAGFLERQNGRLLLRPIPV